MVLRKARVADVAAQHLDLAGLQLANAGQDRQQGRLAHPVRADQADGLLGRDVEADPVQRRHLAVLVGEIPDAGDVFQNRGIHF
jgi:hypothetical protein